MFMSIEHDYVNRKIDVFMLCMVCFCDWYFHGDVNDWCVYVKCIYNWWFSDSVLWIMCIQVWFCFCFFSFFRCFWLSCCVCDWSAWLLMTDMSWRVYGWYLWMSVIGICGCLCMVLDVFMTDNCRCLWLRCVNVYDWFLMADSMFVTEMCGCLWLFLVADSMFMTEMCRCLWLVLGGW